MNKMHIQDIVDGQVQRLSVYHWWLCIILQHTVRYFDRYFVVIKHSEFKDS